MFKKIKSSYSVGITAEPIPMLLVQLELAQIVNAAVLP